MQEMKNIAVVTGGFTEEYVISVQSAASVLAQINVKKYTPYWVEITKKGWFVRLEENTWVVVDKNDFSFIHSSGEKIKFDGAYLLIHGIPGEDGALQGYFSLLDIPVVSPNLLDCALTLHKSFCNMVLQQMGFLTPSLYLLRKNETYQNTEILAKVGLPCFVKPNNMGSSFGASKVNTAQELAPAIDKAFSSSDEVLIESFIQGKEYTCGVTDFSGEIQALPITEIALPLDKDFFDFEAKYQGKSQEITPARLNPADTQKLQNTAKNVYQKLNLKSTVRIDFIWQATGDLYIIEINSIPGMTEKSLIPQQLAVQGIPIADFINQNLDKLFH